MGKPSGGRGRGALVVGEGGEGLSVRREDADDVHEARVLAAPGGRGGGYRSTIRRGWRQREAAETRGAHGDGSGWSVCVPSRNWTKARGKIKNRENPGN